MGNQVTIFSAEATAITFADRKGNAQSMSAEGALFKGGLALAALKDKVMLEAGNKAANGKYRAAADIIGTAFGTVSKSFEKLCGTPWANKSSMVSYLTAIERVSAERFATGKDLTAKQAQAMAFVKALRTIPALASESEPVTIEAGLRRAA